ncbi:hypothetical protein JAAARDRAFT_41423 [Jaapia argillacea MUCL 33604]|uniref:Uncharacterized protein n=1 Tax=Jaapia argillacea MUCL 33604 TaxID=933084 RepID=A0A067PL19_9AGAM|nr:hypothetical protein JAAARDRAFT_41423 [Jaapia argillacea MUCL 33604]
MVVQTQVSTPIRRHPYPVQLNLPPYLPAAHANPSLDRLDPANDQHFPSLFTRPLPDDPSFSRLAITPPPHLFAPTQVSVYPWGRTD